MKIRTKLIILLCTLPFLLLLLLIIGWLQIGSFNNISEELENNYSITTVAESVHKDIKSQAISLRNLVLYTNEEAIKNEINNLDVISSRTSENIQLLESEVSSTEQKKLVNELTVTYQKYNEYRDQISDFVSEGSQEKAISLINEYSTGFDVQFFNLIRDLDTSFENYMHQSLEDERKSFQKNSMIQFLFLAIAIALLMLILFRSLWPLTKRLKHVSRIMNQIANGKKELDTKVEVESNDEIDEVVKSFNMMSSSVVEKRNREHELTWIKSNVADITTSLSGKVTLDELADTFLTKITPLVGGSASVVYVIDEEDSEQEAVFKLCASYAFKERKHVTTTIHEGEGLIGQVIREKSPIILTNVPPDYISIKSGLGEAVPLHLYVLPILFEGDVKGVVEIASFEEFDEKQQVMVEEVIGDLGIIIESLIGRLKQQQLLKETQILMEEVQTQSEELQSQQDELKTINEELEQQTEVLKQSEEKLQQQQEELEQANTELEEKAISLEEQNKRFEEQNSQLIYAKKELEEKAKQLAQSSRYKSEFLANMSHELRTPLNSMLILSQLLSDNKEGTLNSKQVEFAKTIHSSGKDLLALINNILDLSKIESGKMEVNPSEVVMTQLIAPIRNTFQPIANQKGLQFEIGINSNVPDKIYTDEGKLQQVLKNLLANAFKFTKKGKIRLDISLIHELDDHKMIVFSVSDTGIGISEEHQSIIFEAFQQADGTTSRKFGGTGLGLSISKEMAELLGGKLTLESEVGKGSTFRLYIEDYKGREKKPAPQSMVKEVDLPVEKTLPAISATLDTESNINEKMEVTIGENHYIKRLLIVDDDLVQRNSLMELIADMDVIMKAVSTGHEAIQQLQRDKFDCLILDLGLTDTTGFDLLKKIKESNEYDNLKVFIYTGRDMTSKEELYLNRFTHTIIIKDEHSPIRLKKELALYLNKTQNNSREILKEDSIEEIDSTGLEGKKILLVDDDVRNVYALSSILEQYGLDICFAENGIEALELLKEDSTIDLIIMDIMMPELDGYETMGYIRNIEGYKNHPIIALTAKAMKDDREKSLKAGANDYIVKPVDPVQLVSMIKVWLFRNEGDSYQSE